MPDFPDLAPHARLGRMTMPSPDDDEREAGPLGSEVSPPGDEDSQGGSGDSVAGPSYPPAETGPDARQD